MPTPSTEPALVRAADLIGQLGDPNHSRKLNALYYEFVETGIAAQLGYRSPADLAEQYPEILLVQGRALPRHGRWRISSGPWPASSGSPSYTPTCSSRSTSCRGPGRSGPRTAADDQAARVRLALVSAGTRRVCRTTQ